MNCREAEKQIDAYVNGRLEPSAADALKNHLAECGSCRREAALVRRMTDIHEDFTAVKARYGFTENIMNSVYALADDRAELYGRPSGQAARRLGLCFVLSACIAGAGIFTPALNFLVQGGNTVKNSFVRIDRGIRDSLKQVGSGIIDIDGGTEHGQ